MLRIPAPLLRHRDKLLPMVVSLPLFLQNIDTSIMGPALPAMAASLRVDALRLNLAITAYLLSLAIFLPISGWLSDRLGARRVFCGAIGIFSLGSAFCGLAPSLEILVACRVLQGLGGAMMVPVGRLILLRSIPPAAMVSAMVWFTVPPVIGRLLGPLVGGAAVTWLSWHWIFLINVPFGAVAIALALAFVEPGEESQERQSFDLPGFLLLGAGLAAILAALEGAGGHLMDAATSGLLAVFGALSLAAYVLHSRRTAEPLIDLGILRHPTFHAAIIGGLPLRLAIGAMPFLLPLLFQLGFGLSPLQSGVLTVGTAVGALATRGLMTRALRRWSFRRVLLGATTGTSICYMLYALFTANTPQALIFLVLILAGLLLSMVMVSMQTLAYSEIARPLMGHATALSVMVQQVTISLGVLLGSELLRLSVLQRGGSTAHLQAGDFPLAFISIALLVLLSLLAFRRLPADVGAEMRGGAGTGR